MRRFHDARRVPALAAALVVVAAAGSRVATTLAPAAHDFGSVAIGGPGEHGSFTATLSANAGSTDTVDVVLTGPDAAEFALTPATAMAIGPGPGCSGGAGQRSCVILVDFVPGSAGVKHATLEVIDAHGASATASLKGNGVARCRMVVVSCNYAGLYSGTFSWTSKLDDANTHYVETVTVNVIQGQATCSGSVDETEDGQTTHRSVAGPGLFAVEFKATPKRGYLITAACPSPAGPGETSRPAELGHFGKESDWQPATAIGADLVGRTAYNAPEADPLNGVTGGVTIGWTLKR